ncbi:hypothetical protein COLU111180_06930 [Cohnella lubricantis]|uniref:Uncharacterized protein n=1 Tax=Cohnella lubricantis TaxID=2163172 RepID=A0A841TEW2_9BACL|nr:hypothetical protein [Cohnella lubricantis]MBB6678615.1 hypothetical protein [Cohnella lubricantis]MBP2119226.1 gas vesicle protein [Cohnella lubricantis]
MKNYRGFAALLLVVMLTLSLPLEGYAAASVSWTSTTKKSWDKLVAGLDSTQRMKLKGLYNDLAELQYKENRLDMQTKALHNNNAATLSAANSSIKQIDAAKLDSLSAQAKQTRDRYQPMLDKYSMLTKQISAAKALKSKELAKLLQTQADLLKPGVQAAKSEIKKRDDEYKAAKDAASKKGKTVRATLDGITAVNVRMRASKSSVTASKNALSTANKTFAQVVKNGDAKTVASSLSNMLTLYRQLIAYKEKVYGYERDITDIIAKAKSQLPK